MQFNLRVGAARSAIDLLDNQNVPVMWLDSDAGHKVTRLTNEPGSRSLYFNQNAFTPDGKQMVYLVDKSIYVVNPIENNPSRLLVTGPVSSIVVGRKNPTVYFTRPDDRGFYAINVNTAQTLKILDLPPHARITTLNADETLAAGTLIEGEVSSSIQQDTDPVLRSTPLTEEQMDVRPLRICQWRCLRSICEPPLSRLCCGVPIGWMRPYSLRPIQPC